MRFPNPLFRFSPLLALGLIVSAAGALGALFPVGDSVQLTRSDMLLFQGQNFLAAPKGQEFTVLRDDPRTNTVYVAFYKPDGTLIAVTLPASSLAFSPPNAWRSLLQGAEDFRDGRYDEARRRLLQAATDPQLRPIAAAFSARLTGLQAARGAVTPQTIASLREFAGQVAARGYLSVALPLEEGIDRYAPPGGPPAPTNGMEREELKKKVEISNRAIVRCRQAMALHRTYEASKYIEEGLAAEPGRLDLLAVQGPVKKAVQEGDENFEAADRMRKLPDGAPHALTALEHGLKACLDHPKLRALKAEMQGQVEARTAPAVTPALLTAAHVQTSSVAAEEGRKLYTSRCTECHDLELIDSRSISGWEKAVAGMSGRAHLDDTQRARIMEYLTVAWNGIGNEK